MTTICPLKAPIPTGKANVQADIQAYDQHVAELQDSFAKLPANPDDQRWVKSKLSHMVAVDQYMRTTVTEVPHQHGYTMEQSEEWNKAMFPRWTEVDGRNTEDMKALLERHGWFNISRWGVQADSEAWLLVQHADHDRPFQREVLKTLETLYPQGETRPANYAYLFDRVAVAAKEPQRYGTQGRCTGPGTWEPWTCEEPERLDERRASVGLGSEAEYIAGFKNICR